MALWICATCGTIGTSKTFTPGNCALEVLLWLCLLLPGFLYSVWRLSSRQQVCRACGASGLVPASSPRGKQLQAEFAKTP